MRRVVLSSRGQISIPAETRKKMGIKPGQAFRIFCLDERIVLVPEAKDPIEKGLGLLSEDTNQKSPPQSEASIGDET